MDYDPTQEALYQPGLRAAVFGDYQLLGDGIFAELARLAYVKFELKGEHEARLISDLERAGLHSFAAFKTDRTSTQGFGAVGANGDVYVAFRGTQADDPTDIFTDLKAALKEWHPAGQVHKGFAEAFESIWPAVQKWLGPHDGTKVHFTGHSLGAALATLAASRWSNATLVTFGSPRVGDDTFAKLFTGRTVRRYVNCSDVVTQLPPERLGYEHAGVTRYIDQHGTLQTWTEDTTGDPISKDRWSGRAEYLLDYAWRPGDVGSRDLADHTPVNYVRAFARP